jgi:hypothetical protein
MNKITIILVALAILTLWAVIGLMPLYIYKEPSDQGTFGDMFGAVNSLFSGLALAGVICAILLQREELKLQRRELELTRTEISRSAQAQAESAKELLQQRMIAEKNIELQAYIALLQSCNEKIMAERSRLDSTDQRFRGVMPNRLNSLKEDLSRLESKVLMLIEAKNSNA